MTSPTANPGPQGLYDPSLEHDACGVAFVADLGGRPSHAMVDLGLTALANLEHRGAKGAETNTGDGAGILVQLPQRFLAEEAAAAGIDLPAPDRYATGIAFLPQQAGEAAQAQGAVAKVAASEGLAVLGWREVPVVDGLVGEMARRVQPTFRQVFMAGDGLAGDDLERRVFVVRKRVEHEVPGVYFPSLSSRTMVYKGMLTAPQLPQFFCDLADQRVESALALVHSRFSTNTFPSWPLAHPYRYLCHNGEINTIAGNRNWMRAREALMRTDLIPGYLERIFPALTPGASDSATFDEALELLHQGGRSLPHAVLMMIPEAWENHESMDPARRDFYKFHASLMEPWDGPAAIAFTDGRLIGAVLDRNGLRPARWWVTADGVVVMASEVGVLDLDPARVVRKGRLAPGRMFLVDTSAGRIVDDAEIKAGLAAQHPYGEWLHAGLVDLDALAPREPDRPSHGALVAAQQLHGWTQEDMRILVGPMAAKGVEPIGSMGSDTPPAVLSSRPRLMFDYFSQLFAQVTNPPLDAIREELVTSLRATLGPEGNLLEASPASCRQVVLESPVLDNDQLARLVHVNDDGDHPGLAAATVTGCYAVEGGGEALRAGIERARAEVSRAIAAGASTVVLSDRCRCHPDPDASARPSADGSAGDPAHRSAAPCARPSADGSAGDPAHRPAAPCAPIPSLLLTSAVHHHLIRERTRTRVGLVVEAGDAREVHHVCLLLGYGASAVNPWLAFETVCELVASGAVEGPVDEALHRYVKALGKGVLKVMSKLGISTVASYTGAQVFEALGVSQAVADEYFTGTVSKLGGAGLDEIAAEVAARHARAYPADGRIPVRSDLENGGEYQWRRDGEVHLFNPRTVFKLQHATRSKRYQIFKEYTQAVDDQAGRQATLRGLFRLRTGGEPGARPSVPIEEVEPVSSIVTRFATGAMSYGSISAEAHENLAIAMNRLGGRSNTGEGGEDAERYIPLPNGDSRRSAVKQVASGRFGVTSEYLVNADDLQIKMAQGAKPGEGGQLPGHKVYPWIARTRFSTPGVGLISPPPHHDIYSIEDLAQLIHDLKNANPRARVHVKLVAEVGVGTVAAGVSKAHADVVLISGNDGGTGASPLTSLKHAGAPWELGLAETQQTLLLNNLRDRIVVQVDGQLKTGRDVVVAALLGAEEYGFATAPLVVSGCIMMRVCHLDTCPVGVATQNPELRKRFNGKPEFVETFFEYLAEEVREHLAALGFRSLEEAVGQAEALDVAPALDHWKASGLDLSPILAVPDLVADGRPRRCVQSQDHGLDRALDAMLIERCRLSLDSGAPLRLDLPINNTNRTVGTMLGSELTRRWGAEGLPDDTIDLRFSGSAGQSFGAFLPRGITLRLDGDANDYVGKGLSGGRLVLRPPAQARNLVAEDNIIAGNVVLYGATGGEALIRGQVGERFCVRNSGATAVVEGVGDHACEYMTGGRAVILGPTGRNVGAGMSGGIAYVWDPDGTLARRLNPEMVDLERLDPDDRQWLHRMVRRHLAETSSARAEALVGSWWFEAKRFVKVMPKDYRRVLEATRLAEEHGESVDEAIMAAARG